MDHLLKLLKSNSSSGIPSVSLAQTSINSKALSCSNSAPWIIYSGAFDHMTIFSNIFSSYSPCSSSEKNCIADGSFSPIVGKGLIKIYENITLKFVLHIPNLLVIFCLSENCPKMLIVLSPSLNLIVNFRIRGRGRRLAVLE